MKIINAIIMSHANIKSKKYRFSLFNLRYIAAAYLLVFLLSMMFTTYYFYRSRESTSQLANMQHYIEINDHQKKEIKSLKALLFDLENDIVNLESILSNIEKFQDRVYTLEKDNIF